MIGLCGSARVAGVDKLSGGRDTPSWRTGGRTCDFMCRDAACTLALVLCALLWLGKLFWTSTAAHLAWLPTDNPSSFWELLFNIIVWNFGPGQEKISHFLVRLGYSMIDEHLPIYLAVQIRTLEDACSTKHNCMYDCCDISLSKRSLVSPFMQYGVCSVLFIPAMYY